jgi:cytochrome P450
LVVVSISGANRDPAVFTDPNSFDLTRPNAKLNLSFARGPHFCPAMDLARLEAGAVLRTLLTQFPLLRLDERYDPAPRGLVFRRPEQLHVRWD